MLLTSAPGLGSHPGRAADTRLNQLSVNPSPRQPVTNHSEIFDLTLHPLLTSKHYTDQKLLTSSVPERYTALLNMTLTENCKYIHSYLPSLLYSLCPTPLFGPISSPSRYRRGMNTSVESCTAALTTVDTFS
ncbi:hypothetical protein E2C01_014339 [Portunus trituberculatus]|uniref:Uncharacterized protein n=1 Tax=Portunus trituberculatus TaxID=210409 RepID=A0A5B7DK71_PORTR|nr:hypothetical protein [Portunus trituberculatus]